MRGTYEKRVFIAGSYKLPSLIKDIETVVEQCDFIPIKAEDFGISKEQVRHYCMRLLKQCGIAIFEVSVESGQLMELERAHDYMPITLCLWSKGHEGIPKISDMVTSSPLFQRNNKGYATTRQLQSEVEAFLKSIDQ